ncbi:MAG: iron ABC transporter permease [Parvibaculum sp.]|nr:iron ABC transporter permease [Parvibaculum sp.]
MLKRLHGRIFSVSHAWLVVSGLLAFLAVAPLVVLVGIAAEGSGALWPHLMAYVLPTAIVQTGILLFGVGAFVLIVGVGAAWAVTAYDFTGRRIIEWALLLPLAVPTYVVAFAYLDILHPLGPVQSLLRDLLGIVNPGDLKLPDIRSMAGCILLLGFVLYPYVYLSSRAMFLLQPASLMESARTLGAGPIAIFWHVALPAARPGIAVGGSLALMEALNDIGAAQFLGVQTLTVSIYSTWVNRSSLSGAAQIALLMLAIVLVLILLERWGRRHRDDAVGSDIAESMVPKPLTGFANYALMSFLVLPIFLGFVAPALFLVVEAIARIDEAGLSQAIIAETGNTIFIAAAATIIIVVTGFCMAYAVRLVPGKLTGLFLRAGALGYAIPGTVLAISLLVPLAAFDNAVDALAQSWFGISTGLLLSGSGAALIYAYAARFMVIASGGIEAGLNKISLSIDETAATLGAGRRAITGLLHLPLLRPALASAALLVFVDCIKELPATLLLRPFDFETLATHLYAEASRGTYEDGSIAAVLIIMAGLAPIILLSRLSLPVKANDAEVPELKLNSAAI